MTQFRPMWEGLLPLMAGCPVPLYALWGRGWSVSSLSTWEQPVILFLALGYWTGWTRDFTLAPVGTLLTSPSK